LDRSGNILGEAGSWWDLVDIEEKAILAELPRKVVINPPGIARSIFPSIADKHLLL
jgi:hypothetical protein